MSKHSATWGFLIFAVVFAMMGACLWLTIALANRVGSGWEGPVLRSGTAQIIDCRRAFSGLFLDHVCRAEIEWDRGSTPPTRIREAKPPYTVWSPTNIEGEHRVTSHRKPPLTRRSNPQEVVATLDHPAGTSRLWMGGGFVAAIVLPFVIAGFVMKVLMMLGLVRRPSAKKRPDGRASSDRETDSRDSEDSG